MGNNWFRSYRDRSGLSQEELVARLQLAGIDISRGTLSNWETGRVSIPLGDRDLRWALANVFRLSVPDLLKAAGYEIELGGTEWSRRAAWVVDQLPEADRDFALEMLERLLEKSHQRER